MQSDFLTARLCLEQAHSMMKGEDPRSGLLREAIELLVEAVITAEHSQAAVAGKVVPFPSRQAS